MLVPLAESLALMLLCHAKCCSPVGCNASKKINANEIQLGCYATQHSGTADHSNSAVPPQKIADRAISIDDVSWPPSPARLQ